MHIWYELAWETCIPTHPVLSVTGLGQTGEWEWVCPVCKHKHKGCNFMCSHYQLHSLPTSRWTVSLCCLHYVPGIQGLPAAFLFTIKGLKSKQKSHFPCLNNWIFEVNSCNNGLHQNLSIIIEMHSQLLWKFLLWLSGRYICCTETSVTG